MPQPKFNYSIKKSSFKRTHLVDHIHSQENVDNTNGYISRYGIKDPFDMLIILQNLEGLTTDLIDSLDERFQYFQVVDEFHSLRNSIKLGDKVKYFTNSKDEITETKEDGSESYAIYSRQELKSIIEKIEEIEKGTESLDEFTKAVTIYDRLKRHIKYNYNTDNESSFKTRSLRGLVSGKSVCAGYAHIFQHILQRQGIKCKYVTGNAHAWNVIIMGDKRYPVDLTLDSQLYHSGFTGLNSMYYFGRDAEEFKKKHVDENNWYNDGLENFSQDKVSKAMNFSNLHTTFTSNNDCFVLQRDDGSRFLLTEIASGSINIPDTNRQMNIYKYIYIPIENNRLIFQDAKIVSSGTSYLDIVQNIEYASLKTKDYVALDKYKKMAHAFINQTMIDKNIKKAEEVFNSNFVGTVYFYSTTNSYESINGDKIVKAKPFELTDMEIIDNQIILKTPGDNFNTYRCYSVDGQKGKIIKNMLYSESDLFKLPKNEEKKIFDSLFLERLACESGGYMGYISQNGNIVQDPENLLRATTRAGIKVK